MELRHLRYFAMIAEEGHMTRAAERLGLQQPPLSMQIKALENQLGTPLFIRHSRGVSLSNAGQIFLVKAKRILEDVAALELQMSRAAKGVLGTVDIGFTASAGAHAFLPLALQRCRQEFPEIDLVITETPAVVEMVVAGRLHFGLLRVPASAPEGVKFETLFREKLVVALPVTHAALQGRPAGRARTFSLLDLRDETFIMSRIRPGAPGFAADFVAACQAQGFQPRIGAEVERLMTSLNLVAAGTGISIVPASMSGVHREAVVYCPLKSSEHLDIPMTMAYRNAHDGAVTTVINLFKRLAAKPAYK